MSFQKSYFVSNVIVLGIISLLFTTAFIAESAETSTSLSINHNNLLSAQHKSSFDQSSKLPSFLWLNSERFARQQLQPASTKQAQLESLSKKILQQLSDSYGFSEAALDAIRLVHLHDTGKGAIIVQLKQYFQDMEVLDHRLSIVFNRQLQPISISGFLSPHTPSESADISNAVMNQALSTAFEELTGNKIPHSLWQQSDHRDSLTNSIAGNANHKNKNQAPIWMKLPEDFILKNTQLHGDVRTQSGWLLDSSGKPQAVTHIEMETSFDGSDSRMFRYLISAQQQIIQKNNLTREALKSYRVWSDTSAEKLPFAGPQGNGFFPHPTGQDDDTLITLTNSSIVSLDSANFSRMDPWLTDNQTSTSGNNVNAYVDISLPDGFTPFSEDHQAQESSPGQFDYDYNFADDPTININLQNAALVQAFYVTNYIHDWLYDAGFDEASGNGQQNNFGRGGAGNDAMLVEVQDFEARNNASMTTPSDGSAARMQVYLWDGNTQHQFEIEAASALAGIYETGAATFGPKSFDVNQQLVLVDDAQIDPLEIDSTIHDACEDPIINAADLNGKIVVIDRGVCFFVVKIDRVESLGASAVIIINQKTDGVLTMGAGDNPPQIDIPSLMISKADGDPLRNALLNGENITARLLRTTDVDRDAALDNSLVIHEWGHFLDNRLVTINNTQSQGLDEGWSDFLMLLFLTREEDLANIDGAFAFSSFANNRSNAAYFGIRRVPYSTNMALNGLTFKHIANGQALPASVPTAFGSDGSDNAEEHATGEVWATMLWEGYVGLLKDPRHSFAEAQTRMKNYLVASLKATPTGPNFIEARDALLAVIAANDTTDRNTFMDAFARRGLGAGAIAPNKASETNQSPVESFVTDSISTPPPPPTPPNSSGGGGGSMSWLMLLVFFYRANVRNIPKPPQTKSSPTL